MEEEKGKCKKEEYIILKCNPRGKAGILRAIWKFYLEVLPEAFANQEIEKRLRVKGGA